MQREVRDFWWSAGATTLVASVLCVAIDSSWVLIQFLLGADPLEDTLFAGSMLRDLILVSQLYALWLLSWVALTATVVLVLARVLGRSVRGASVTLAILSLPAWALWLGSMTRGGSASAYVEPWHLVVGAIVFAALQCLATNGWFGVIEPRLRAVPRLRAACYLAASAACLLADRTLYPGLYPAAHGLLALFAFAALYALAWPDKPQPRSWLALPMIGAVLFAAPVLRPADGDPFMNFYLDKDTLFTRHAQRALGHLRALGRDRASEGPSRGSTEVFQRSFDVLEEGGRTANLVFLSGDGVSPWRIQTGSPDDGELPTTPFLRQLAEASVVFERHYATYPMTQASLKALFTGVVHADGYEPLPTRGPGLLGWVRERGLSSFCAIPFGASIIGDIAGPDWSAGDALCDTVVNERSDARVEDALMAFAAAPFAGPRFVFVHLLGPHEPMQAEPEDVRASDGDLYRAALMTLDRRLERIVAAVGRWPGPTRVVFTSDHGHAFGWHGLSGHASHVYEDQMRIPLILRGFGYPAQRVLTPTSTIDLTALLIGDARALPLHDALRRGVSPPQLAPLFGSFHGLRMLVEGDLKLIVDEVSGGAELYDVRLDVEERNNLAMRHPETMVMLRARLSSGAPFLGRAWP